MNRNKTAKEILIYTLVIVSILLITGTKAKADFTFREPMNLGPVINAPMHEYNLGISRDGLFLCFQRRQLDWSGVSEWWVAQRATRYDPWDDPVSLGPWVGTAAGTVTVFNAVVETIGGVPWGWGTADDLETYICHTQLGGYGGDDLFVLKRETVDAEWGPPENLGPTVNTSNNDIWGPVSPDGLTLYFSSFGRPGGYGRSDLYVTTRATRSDPWGEAINLGATVNSTSYDYVPSISPDGLLLFFTSGRTGGFGGDDTWMTRRRSLLDPWEQAVNLGPTMNTSADDWLPYISPDGSTLYFCSTQSNGYGGFDLWQASITPNVDFNGDGIVDAADVCIIVDNWGTDNSLCDIGPMPWGDGIVDVQDLIVIAGHLFEEFPPADPNI